MRTQISKFGMLLFFTIGFLLGCNSTTSSNNAPLPALLDSKFPNYHEYAIEQEHEIFALDESMMRFIDVHTGEGTSEKEKLSKLLAAIFDHTDLSISYSAAANTSAMDTFYNGTANCLSLTVMTYAMTQYLGMDSEFQNIHIPEFWTRRDGQTLINKHINLRVKAAGNTHSLARTSSYVVDFDPQENTKQLASSKLSKSQIVSFFYTNKAADHMISKEPEHAYAYLRAAVLHDPNNEGAWLNLGVLSSQHQLYAKAQSYYEMAIKLNPTFTTAYENLAILYERQGEVDRAEHLLADLHNKRLENPYYHMVNGDIAMEQKNYDDAIEHYKDAITINHSPHEFHFKLAKAYYRIGDMKNSQRYLDKAKQRTNNDTLIEQYNATLSNVLAKR